MQSVWRRIVELLGTIIRPGADFVKALLKLVIERLHNFWDWLGPRKRAFVDVISFYRGAALPAAGLAFAFAAFDQTHEVYLQLAEDGARIGASAPPMCPMA